MIYEVHKNATLFIVQENSVAAQSIVIQFCWKEYNNMIKFKWMIRVLGAKYLFRKWIDYE